MRAVFTRFPLTPSWLFNLLCAPCFAAIGAIKREMNNAKWTWFAIGYLCVFAYAIALIVYQLGCCSVKRKLIGSIAAFVIFAIIAYMWSSLLKSPAP